MFVNSILPTKITHIVNKKDYVLTYPPQFLGYAQTNGEVHIKEDNTWVSCPGHDNPSPQCIVGNSPIIFDSLVDHGGPYDGVEMGC
ncbi:hypothetical protein L218DRAFT_851319 [Marasmius fiardii PR-910]|nr:hypothetical protein L218DRAFT_851319 [Marasmius fiardii PR-910]